MIKMSVVVPVYNVSKYLAKCLDSLVSQTLKDIEIIVVNDGSTDNSQEIIAEYEKNYHIIKAYSKKNGGLSDARNYGIAKAKGEYLAFVDSDDYVDKTMMEKMYNYAKNNKLDIVCCDCFKVYENSLEKVELKANLNYSNDNIKNYLLSPVMAWMRIYKRSIFEKIKFQKGIYYEDLELIPKLVKQTKKIGFLNESLYYYLQRSGSIMQQKEFNIKLLDIFSVLESNYQELYITYPQEIEYMYITHLLRTATLRFLDYDNYQENIAKIVKIFDNRFCDWAKNPYYKKSSIKLKIICVLAYNKCYKLLRLLKKFN